MTAPRRPTRVARYADGGTPNISYVSNIPDEARPAYSQLIKDAQDVTAQPYQPYTSDRIAQFTDLQKQGFEGIGALAPNAMSTDAGGIAGLAANRALSTGP